MVTVVLTALHPVAVIFVSEVCTVTNTLALLIVQVRALGAFEGANWNTLALLFRVGFVAFWAFGSADALTCLLI